MAEPRMQPSFLPRAINEMSWKSVGFTTELAEQYGMKKKDWHNNNSTVVQNVYVLDIEDLNKVSEIYKKVFEFNQLSGEPSVTVVPVAGWKEKPRKTTKLHYFYNIAEETLLKEYAQSFSLNPIAAKGATILLRAAKNTHKMEIFEKNGQHFVRVSAGVRITDLDTYLSDNGFALPPNMPTLHVCSAGGGTANGCIGPTRGLGPMTTSIEEMVIINAMGQTLTLSATANTHLFDALRHCHLGTCFVLDLVFKIEPKFLMKRHSILLKDMAEFKQVMLRENKFDKEHFILMYIPVDIDKEGNHAARMRLTTMERTDERPEKLESKEQKDFSDCLSLELTNVGEPFIEEITKSPILQPYFSDFLNLAALKTYGIEKETVEINYSAPIMHIFGTYTSKPIADLCWFIPVKSSSEAFQVTSDLGDIIEKRLIQLGKKHEYPLLNTFVRYVKGVYYPEGKGGIAPTAVDQEDTWEISYELVTYDHLAKTPAFTGLVELVIDYLATNNRNYSYHPGKTLPEGVVAITQYLTRKNIEKFYEAVYEIHGGKDNVRYSPFLTSRKKEFLGLAPISTEQKETETVFTIYDKEQGRKRLCELIKYAKKNSLTELKKKAEAHLKQL